MSPKKGILSSTRSKIVFCVGGLLFSAVVLLTVNMLERRDFLVSGGKRRGTA